VEIVRAIYDAFARRDRDALMRHLDPLIRVYGRPFHPDASVYEGREGFLRFSETDWEAFEEVVYEPQDFVPSGSYVVVQIKQSGRGKSSAVGIEQRIVNVWKLRRGKCVELRIYSTMEEALEAVGHQEPAMSREDAGVRALAEKAFGALNSGDLDGFLGVATEDVEFTSLVAEVEGTTFRGHDGVRTWWETVRGAFADVRWEVLEVRRYGDRGVADVRMTGTLGGVPVNLMMWLAARVREDRVSWWSFFRTEREALQALGLRE
jgi:ketosteroid isomerase-like protein